MPVVESFQGKQVLVMGLGRFGGGIGVTRWLVGQGARVSVTDLADAAALADSMKALDGLDVTYRLGGHDEADLDGVDLIVVSPAVDKNKSEFFQRAVARGLPWTSETNLFFERCQGQIVGITGSVGKSTTTAMIGEILTAALAGRRDAPRVWVGGNIGRSLLDELPNIRRCDVVVLELSSFQLEDLASVRLGPSHAVLTNLRPNHLDRHGTMDAYADAKMNLVRFLRRHGSIAYNGDDPELRRWLNVVRPEDPDGGYKRPVSFSDPHAWVHVEDGAIVAYEESAGPTRRATPQAPIGRFEPVIRLDAMGVPGRHNVYNAMLAVNVGLLFDASYDAMAAALQGFRGLPHRLEFVTEIDGVRYFNDSKCTTPDAAITAVEAFDGPVVVIAGGYDKGSSFDGLGAVLARRARGVICLGATQKAIAAAVAAGANGGAGAEVRCVADLHEACVAARELARPGDVVLLSPACASWDMFTNYEARGDQFKQTVLSWQSR